MIDYDETKLHQSADGWLYAHIWNGLRLQDTYKVFMVK